MWLCDKKCMPLTSIHSALRTTGAYKLRLPPTKHSQGVFSSSHFKPSRRDLCDCFRPITQYVQDVFVCSFSTTTRNFIFEYGAPFYKDKSRPSRAGIGRSAWGVIRAPCRVSPESLKSTMADCIQSEIVLYQHPFQAHIKKQR